MLQMDYIVMFPGRGWAFFPIGTQIAFVVDSAPRYLHVQKSKKIFFQTLPLRAICAADHESCSRWNFDGYRQVAVEMGDVRWRVKKHQFSGKLARVIICRAIRNLAANLYCRNLPYSTVIPKLSWMFASCTAEKHLRGSFGDASGSGFATYCYLLLSEFRADVRIMFNILNDLSGRSLSANLFRPLKLWSWQLLVCNLYVFMRLALF